MARRVEIELLKLSPRDMVNCCEGALTVLGIFPLPDIINRRWGSLEAFGFAIRSELLQTTKDDQGRVNGYETTNAAWNNILSLLPHLISQDPALVSRSLVGFTGVSFFLSSLNPEIPHANA